MARVRYRVTKLPQYLIVLHMRRFVKNNLVVYKIPMLVNFPLKNLEMKDYIPLPTPTKATDSKYDLIANIVHDGRTREGPSSCRVFVERKSEKLWYEMQDLHVSEICPEMVELSEAYM